MRPVLALLRTLVVLLLLAAAVFAGAFFADHPGDVTIVWQGWTSTTELHTSIGVLAVAVMVLVVAVWLLALLVSALRRLPRNLRRRRAARRRLAGDAFLTRGLVALAAGRAAEAGRHAGRAAVLLDGAPIPLLLMAEAATRQGDEAAARLSYTALLDRPDTAFLALRGLLGQALRAGDDIAALRLAERARRLRPDAAWLLDSLLVLQARADDWNAARAALAGATRRKVLPAERARHHHGVVLHELSRQAERRGDQRQAAKLAAKAQALAPDLAAPALHHARLLSVLGRRRAAAKAIERAWRHAPHPDLVRPYLEVQPDAGLLAQVAAVQRLAAQNPQSVESHLAVAEAALMAQLWGEARHHLALAAIAPPSPERPLAGPVRRLCRLMARLEESEAGNTSAAREWLDRAIGAPPDPSYLCAQCGAEAPEWQALCRACGAFDTVAWRSPPSAAAALGGAPAGVAMPLILPSLEVLSDRAGDRDVAAPPSPRAGSGLAPPPQSAK